MPDELEDDETTDVFAAFAASEEEGKEAEGEESKVEKPKPLMVAPPKEPAAKEKRGTKPVAPKAEGPEPVQPAQKLVYRVDGDYVAMIGHHRVTFTRGQVITDQYHIQFLLQHGAPISPANDGSQFYVCERCGNHQAIRAAQ